MFKKVLIIENSNHYHILDHLCQLYKDKGYVVELALDFNTDKQMIESMFKENKNFKIIDIKNKNYFFLKLFLKSKKYDLFHISTGAENTYFKFFLNILFFFLFSFFYGKKIVLQIRNCKYFLLTKNLRKFLKVSYKKKNSIKHILMYSYANFFRYFLLNFLNKILFESNTQLIFFNKFTSNRYKKKSFYLYSRNSTKIIEAQNINDKVNIGIPGSYNLERRNYYELLNSFSSLNDNQCRKIKLYFIGNFRNADNRFISILKNHNIEIVYYQKFIDTKLYNQILGQLDFLLSIHAENRNTFTFAGSGLIGDLVSTNLNLIIKKRFDPFGEFNNRSIYYKNLSVLFNRITNIDKSKNINIKNDQINLSHKYLNKNRDYLRVVINV